MAISLTARATALKLEALTKLGVARRERLDRADFQVYLPALETVPVFAVVEGCRRLGLQPPGDFEPRYPPLAHVVATCAAVVEEDRRRKALAAPSPDEAPASPERIAQLLADCKAEVARHDLARPWASRGARR